MPMTSTAKVLVKGRNFPLLLERLKKHDVHLLKIRKISETETIITVKYKDLTKVFAISQNMWYNKLTGLGGFVLFKQKLVKNLFALLMSLLFIIASLFCDNFVFKVDVYGASGEKLAKIYKIAEDFGAENGKISIYCDEKKLQKTILQTVEGVDFCTVKKSGNRLIINVFFGNKASNEQASSQKIVAQKSGRILFIKAYSGTALKNAGEFCYQNEELVGGFYIDENGEKKDAACLAEYILECYFSKEYILPIGNDPDELSYKAAFDGGIDDSEILGCEITPKLQSFDKTTYEVKITYLYRGGKY